MAKQVRIFREWIEQPDGSSSLGAKRYVEAYIDDKCTVNFMPMFVEVAYKDLKGSVVPVNPEYQGLINGISSSINVGFTDNTPRSTSGKGFIG